MNNRDSQVASGRSIARRAACGILDDVKSTGETATEDTIRDPEAGFSRWNNAVSCLDETGIRPPRTEAKVRLPAIRPPNTHAP